MTSKRRFIAGAVCPQCAAVDRTVIEDEDSIRRRRCIACGFTDAIEGSASGVPRGRLDRSRDAHVDQKKDVPEQTVRIVPKRQ